MLILVINFFPEHLILPDFKFTGLKLSIKGRNTVFSILAVYPLYLHLYLGSRCWSHPFTALEIGLAVFSPHGPCLTALHLGVIPRFSPFIHKGLQAPWLCFLSV